MEEKINPLNGFSQQVNHNLSEIRRLFNPQTERMGNRRKEEEGGGGRGRVGVGWETSNLIRNITQTYKFRNWPDLFITKYINSNLRLFEKVLVFLCDFKPNNQDAIYMIPEWHSFRNEFRSRDKFVLHRHDKIDGLSLKRSSRLRGFALRQIR